MCFVEILTLCNSFLMSCVTDTSGGFSLDNNGSLPQAAGGIVESISIGKELVFWVFTLRNARTGYQN